MGNVKENEQLWTDVVCMCAHACMLMCIYKEFMTSWVVGIQPSHYVVQQPRKPQILSSLP
jgi:hypothetical protein